MDKARGALGELMAAVHARGELVVDDPDGAALRFLALCKSDLFFNRLFGVRGPLSRRMRSTRTPGRRSRPS